MELKSRNGFQKARSMPLSPCFPHSFPLSPTGGVVGVWLLPLQKPIPLLTLSADGKTFKEEMEVPFTTTYFIE